MLTQSSRASDMVSIGSPWRVIRSLIHLVVAGTAATDIVKFGAIALMVALAVLLIRGLPSGAGGYGRLRARPGLAVRLAVRAALVRRAGLGAAARWSRWCPGRPRQGLAWLLLARTAALGFGYLPARQTDAALPSGLGWLQPVIRHGVTPAVLAVATAWLVVLMVRSGVGRLGGGAVGHRNPSFRSVVRRACVRPAGGRPAGAARRNAREGGQEVSPAAGVRDAAEAGVHRPTGPAGLAERLAGLAAVGGGGPLLSWLWVAGAGRRHPPGARLPDRPAGPAARSTSTSTGPAGHSGLRGQPLYTVLTQPPRLLPFTYPPAAALFAVPLARPPWPARPARLGARGRRAAGPGDLVRVRAAAAPSPGGCARRRSRSCSRACAYLFPVRDEMRFGQVDLVLLAVGSWRTARPARRAGRAAPWSGWPPRSSRCPGCSSCTCGCPGRRRAALTAAPTAWPAPLAPGSPPP